MAHKKTGRPVGRPRGGVKPSPKESSGVPMPTVARLAVDDALGLGIAEEAAPAAPPALPDREIGMHEFSSPAQATDAPISGAPESETGAGQATASEPPRERKRRKGGRHRSRAELAAENRELRERLGPTEAPTAPPVPVDPSDARKMCTDIVQFIFYCVAEERGAHWKLPDDKAAVIGHHFGNGLAPYMPAMGEALPFFFGGVALGKAIIDRRAIDRDLSAQRAAGISATVVPS